MGADGLSTRIPASTRHARRHGDDPDEPDRANPLLYGKERGERYWRSWTGTALYRARRRAGAGRGTR